MTPDKKAFMIAALAARTERDIEPRKPLSEYMREVGRAWGRGLSDLFDVEALQKGDSARESRIRELQAEVVALTQERDYYRGKNKELQRAAAAACATCASLVPETEPTPNRACATCGSYSQPCVCVPSSVVPVAESSGRCAACAIGVGLCLCGGVQA